VSVDSISIQTIDLTKRFPGQVGWRGLLGRKWEKLALVGVNLEVSQGEIFGLLGPNGAGKTTLIKILSTLLLPSSGAASISGLDVVERSREVRAKLGLIYGDERTFFWRLSAIENLRFYAGLYGIPGAQAEERIDHLLDLVGLEGEAHRPMHHFSTGMKQRAAIARGLLNNPEVLFMDEPTRSLDPVAAKELRALIEERVVDRSRTVLLATHQIQEAEALCDRVAFISQGRIEHTGTVHQLQRLFRTEELHRVVVSRMEGTALEALRNFPGVRSLSVEPLDDSTYSLEIGVERGTAVLPQIIREIVSAGGDVWSSMQRELTLEEIFAIAIHGNGREVAAGGGEE
jgi:ABC-2 type transport system ATP-binding protein